MRNRQLIKEKMAEANKEDLSPEKPQQEQQSVRQLRSINLSPEQVVVEKEEASAEEDLVFDVQGIKAHSTEEEVTVLGESLDNIQLSELTENTLVKTQSESSNSDELSETLLRTRRTLETSARINVEAQLVLESSRRTVAECKSSQSQKEPEKDISYDRDIGSVSTSQLVPAEEGMSGAMKKLNAWTDQNKEVNFNVSPADSDNKKGLDVQRITYSQDKSICLLYTSPSPRDGLLSRMPSSA